MATASLAELVRSFRTNSGLSQEMLAERCGLSTRAVSDIETGVARTPRLVTLMLLGEALGLSPSDRLRLEEAGRKSAAADRSFSFSPALALRETALEGRESDVEQVISLLARDATRLVTLTGPPGVGKTSVAVNVASALAGEYEHGAALADLATVEDVALVAEAVARALGIRESVAAHLGARNVLLVLDNLEHLTPAAAWIDALLAASPRVTILATSREPLHLAIERVYAVRPLSAGAAVRLFARRARAVKPDFEVTETNAAAVAGIVEHLEGLPLAIELAASRVLTLPPRAFVAPLRRLPLLGSGALDRPPRQQTMRAAIAWSYDLLSEDERRLFRNLAVLAGGGSLEAAAAVAGDDRARPILERLSPLVQKSLITIEQDSRGEPRVTMLEVLREFGQERLAQSGELAAAQRAHAQYVLHFARRASSGCEMERRNIEAALEWAQERGETEFGLRMIDALWRSWLQHRRLADGIRWVATFCALRNAAPSGANDVLYATALGAKAALLSALGSLNEALGPCEEAIALQRAGGDDAGLAASLAALGAIMHVRGERARAENAYAESLQIRERLGDEAGEAACLANLASLAQGAGDFAGAAAYGQRSVAIYRRLDDRVGLARALTVLGQVAVARRKYVRAEGLFGEALVLQRAAGTIGSPHDPLANLAAVAHRRGEHELALARYGEAFELLGAVPNKAALARMLEGLAAATAAVGDASRAARLHGAAHALRTATGSPLFPAERAEYEAEVAAIRATLGDDAFLVQWRIGLSMTLERALDEVRQHSQAAR